MVSVLSANGHNMRPDVGHGEAHGAERIGDDLRSAAGGDLEKGVAEPLDLHKS